MKNNTNKNTKKKKTKIMGKNRITKRGYIKQRTEILNYGRQEKQQNKLMGNAG